MEFRCLRVKWEQEIKADPSLASQQPYKAIIEKDPAFFEGVASRSGTAIGASPARASPSS
jgi:hypothetical protein